MSTEKAWGCICGRRGLFVLLDHTASVWSVYVCVCVPLRKSVIIFELCVCSYVCCFICAIHFCRMFSYSAEDSGSVNANRMMKQYDFSLGPVSKLKTKTDTWVFHVVLVCVRVVTR